MAEDDRRSSLGQGDRALVIDPIADGSIDAADRRHIAGFFRFLAEDDDPIEFGGGGGTRNITTAVITQSITSIF